MTDLERRIWEWLPKRRSRQRVTDCAIIALHVDAPISVVAETVDRMVKTGTVARTVSRGRTSHYRGLWPATPSTSDPALWEDT